MGYYDENPRKRLAMAFFIAAYLLPLTLLFLLLLINANVWAARLIMALCFGLPLAVLWVVVLRYPLFKKGVPPLAPELKSTKLILFVLSQGVLVVTVSLAAPLYIRQLVQPSAMMGATLVAIGLVGVPAALFAGAVLLKAWKERHHAT